MSQRDRARRRQEQAVPPLPPEIQNALMGAQVVEKRAQIEQKQMDFVARMFISETARTIYTKSIEYMDNEPTTEELIRLAQAAARASEVLGVVIGMIHPPKWLQGDSEEGEESSAEAEADDTTEGGIVLP